MPHHTAGGQLGWARETGDLDLDLVWLASSQDGGPEAGPHPDRPVVEPPGSSHSGVVRGFVGLVGDDIEDRIDRALDLDAAANSCHQLFSPTDVARGTAQVPGFPSADVAPVAVAEGAHQPVETPTPASQTARSTSIEGSGLPSDGRLGPPSSLPPVPMSPGECDLRNDLGGAPTVMKPLGAHPWLQTGAARRRR